MLVLEHYDLDQVDVVHEVAFDTWEVLLVELFGEVLESVGMLVGHHLGHGSFGQDEGDLERDLGLVDTLV